MRTTKDKKNNIMQIRVSGNELEFINQIMALHGYTNRSEFIIDSLIKPQSINKKARENMVYEINKIGVNLMQITRYCNTHKEIDLSVLRTLRQLQNQLEQVLNTYKNL